MHCSVTTASRMHAARTDRIPITPAQNETPCGVLCRRIQYETLRHAIRAEHLVRFNKTIAVSRTLKGFEEGIVQMYCPS